MSDAVLVGIISAVGSIIVTVITVKSTRSELINQLKINQAVTDTKLENLAKKVDEHNGYAKLFSENIPVIKEQIKVANHRIDDLEREAKHNVD